MSLQSKLVIITFLSATASSLIYPMQLVEEENTTLLSIQDASQAKANLYLGQMFLKGHGCGQDYHKARTHFEAAADQEFDQKVRAWALFALGKMYYFEQGVEKNEQKMLQYLERACELAASLSGLGAVIEGAEALRNQEEVCAWRGMTQMHLASFLGHEEVIEEIILSGSDASIMSNDAVSPLLVAVLQGDKNVAEVLLAHGADIDADYGRGCTIFHITVMAVLGGKIGYDALEMLLDYGADIEATSDEGETVLQAAYAQGVEKNKQKRRSYLDKACEVAKRVRGLEEILELGNIFQDHSKEDEKHGNTPIHSAARKGKIKVVKILVAHNVPINECFPYYSGRKIFSSPVKWSLTPLQEAVRNGHKDVVEFLIAQGADVKALEKHENPPLHRAAWREHKWKNPKDLLMLTIMMASAL